MKQLIVRKNYSSCLIKAKIHKHIHTHTGPSAQSEDLHPIDKSEDFSFIALTQRWLVLLKNYTEHYAEDLVTTDQLILWILYKQQYGDMYVFPANADTWCKLWKVWLSNAFEFFFRFQGLLKFEMHV